MTDIQWGPWSGVLQGSPTGFPATPTHSAWSLSASDLEMLQKTMLSMLKDSALSDVCLVVEGIDVPSHKAVLAAWSRPFRAMFTLPMLESRHQCRVVIEEAEHKHLMVVLHYLYGGRIELNDQNVMPVSALANRYEVLPLVAQCEGYMKKRLNPCNVCQQLLAAEEHRVPKAAAFALEFLAVHFDEVYHDSSGDFNSLCSDTVLRVLQHDGLTADEETIFLAVDGWARAWKRRRAICGAPSKIEGSKPSSPAVGKATAQTPGGTGTANPRSWSSHSSVTNVFNVADSSPPKNALQGAQDAPRQCSGNIMGNSAGAMEHDRLEKTKYIAPVRSEGGRPSMTPLAVAATAAPTMSAPPVSAATTAGAAAGAAAAAKKKAEQEQHAIRQQPVITVAPAAADLGAPSRGTHADYTTGSAISPDSSISTPPTPITAVGTGGRGRSGSVGQLSTMVVGEGSGKGEAGGTVRGVLQRRASGPAGGGERGGACVGRVASFTVSPPRPERSVGNVKKEVVDVVACDRSVTVGTVVDPGTGDLETTEDLKAMSPIPEEERESVDGLLEEVRFPLISTSFLCQVVEKSLAISGSRVAQKLLHEAYRFQAMTSADALDVDEHFPGNHRVKYRGHERVLFGEGDGCIGTVDDFSSSLSEVHVVDNVKRKDEKYWLPGQPEEAYFCVRLDRVRRVTKVRFQNRYSEEFEVAVRRTMKEEWQVIVPRRLSGGHKDVQEINLTRKRVKARHIKISLRGRKRSCYNTSCYWTELLGC